MKVAVFGASGFVGTALVLRLMGDKQVEVMPCTHLAGNAWRYSRACIPTHPVNIMAPPAELVSSLKGVTHVVNCTRGPEPVMLQGLKNLLAACREAKVQRFVHLSSISVYAPIPPGDMMHEESPTKPEQGSYGWLKLKQDEMVEAAHRAGLDSVVLCPPNITGIFSGMMNKVVSDMRTGSLALVDGGTRPNSTVDVENLVDAILIALNLDRGDGRRIFVTDGEYVWKDMTDRLMEIAERDTPLPVVSSDDIPLWSLTGKPLPPLTQSLKHLVSSDVRKAVKLDPRWDRSEAGLRRLMAKAGIEERLQMMFEGPRKVSKVRDRNPYNSPYVQVQRRGIWHGIDRARKVLGYSPRLTLGDSMDAYVDWYKQLYGFGSDWRPLARAIETFQVV